MEISVTVVFDIPVDCNMDELQKEVIPALIRDEVALDLRSVPYTDDFATAFVEEDDVEIVSGLGSLSF